MDFYPLNLVFAVAVAAATIFLGFLPTKNIRSEFFARQLLPAILAWAGIAMVSPSAVRHYHYIIAFFCFAAWWQFRRDHALSGKMWLSLASGLGISLGVMLILAVTPRAYPAGLSDLNRTLLLGSIYLGGAVIGLAYVCYALVQGGPILSGATQDQVRRFAGLLIGLVEARVVVLLALFFCRKPLAPKFLGNYLHDAFYMLPTNGKRTEVFLVFILVILILPALAFVARRAIRAGSASQAASALIGICFAGILAETLARLLVL